MQEQCGAHNAQKISLIPMDRIAPRMDSLFGREGAVPLETLAASIRRDGLIEPLTLREGADGRYEIVSGNRRYLACRMLGAARVEAIITTDSPLREDAQTLLARLRQGCAHYLDQADMLRELHIVHGLTREQLAQQLGITPAELGQRLRLADLDAQTRALVRQAALPERCAAALARVSDEEMRRRIARQAAQGEISARDAELLAGSARARLAPAAGGRTIALVRDSRLYLNAVRAIASQLQEAGIRAELTETATTLSLTVSTRRRRAGRHQQSRNSQAAQ